MLWGRHGPDRRIVVVTTTYAIGAYHHFRCEFESHPGEGHLTDWSLKNMMNVINPIWDVVRC
jgi:hypothetical protein